MLHFRGAAIDIHRHLNGRQRRFVEEYLRDGRSKAAAIRAGYGEKSASQAAWRLLRHPAVGAAIRAAQQERSHRLALSADRIVREHARIALSDIGSLVRFGRKGVRLRDGAASPDATASIRAVVRRGRDFSVRLFDKQRSLAFLGATLGVAARLGDEERARDLEARERTLKAFRTMVEQIRLRLGTSAEEAPIAALAEGVATGDPQSVALATRIGLIATPDPPKPGPP
ncbi:MAG TPA: terminase small subunit [Stellaceae bacterium]|nr:terminase small subunit [Stellaceae bacterium]